MQKELSEPRGFCSHYPRCIQATSDPLLCTQTCWLESISGRAAADSPQRMLSAPQGHTVLPAGNSVPENTPLTELHRHGFLPTLHCADSSWTFSNCLEEKLVEFYFPTSHLATESILKTYRCLVPFSPTENSFIWRALGIHTALCHRHPKRGICKGISSHLWNYFSCLTAGKRAVSCCTLSTRAFHQHAIQELGLCFTSLF